MTEGIPFKSFIYNTLWNPYEYNVMNRSLEDYMALNFTLN